MDWTLKEGNEELRPYKLWRHITEANVHRTPEIQIVIEVWPRAQTALGEKLSLLSGEHIFHLCSHGILIIRINMLLFLEISLFH